MVFKKSFEFFHPRVKNRISKLYTNPLGDPPPLHAQCPNKVKNTQIRPKTCFLYLGWSF